MPRQRPRRATVLQRLLLVVLSPLVFLLVLEAGIRVSGIPTDVARNKNFKVAVPTWLLADPDWVRGQERRLETQGPVRAEDVAWFENFREARYIGIKLKPNLDVRVVNPFNDIEVAYKTTFRLTSNRDGFRGRRSKPEGPAVLRVASLGDSSTFGWGVDPEYTYEELLARRLSTNGRPRRRVQPGDAGNHVAARSRGAGALRRPAEAGRRRHQLWRQRRPPGARRRPPSSWPSTTRGWGPRGGRCSNCARSSSPAA